MKQVENALGETVTDSEEPQRELEERNRELNCLHAALDPARTEGLSLEDLLQYTVEVIPLAFRDPEVMCARANVAQRSFVTKNFRETPWVLAQDILVRGQRVGAVEVHFREEASLAETGRLSKEKGHFLKILTARFAELVRRLAADAQVREEREDPTRLVERMQEAMRADWMTPILEVWDKVLLVSVIGVIDSHRANEILERLLRVVSAKRSQFIILDLSGVPVIDTEMAEYLLRWPRSVALLGVSCIITGIRPDVAKMLVALGVALEYDNVKTLRSLKDGLRECLRQMGAARIAGLIWASIFRP